MQSKLSMGERVVGAVVGEVREAVGSVCCASVVAGPPLGVADSEVLARGFNALSDPVRLRIVSMLAAAAAGEICVCDFVAPIGKTQGTVSHHLKVLSEAGLVHGDRRGKWVWYSLDRDRLRALQEALAG